MKIFLVVIHYQTIKFFDMDQKLLTVVLDLCDVKDKQQEVRKTYLDPLNAKEKELRIIVQKRLKQINKSRIDIRKRYTITRYDKVNPPKISEAFVAEALNEYLSKQPIPSGKGFATFFVDYKTSASKKKETLRISRAGADKPGQVSQTLVVGDDDSSSSSLK